MEAITRESAAPSVLNLPVDLAERLKRPSSMETFYQNLSLIIRGGDHWLFEDTPDPTFATGSFKEQDA